MPTIKITTVIHAPVKRCFDLSRSIDLHIESTKHTGETAIAGVTSGLIGLNETVTWRAKHMGLWQKLTSKITEFNSPNYFVDEMVQGAFKSFRHEHQFAATEQGTEMTDIFTFQSPFGMAGQLFNYLFLTSYMTVLLEKRNTVIKTCAESTAWMKFIG